MNGVIVGATNDVSRFNRPNTALRFYGNSEAVLVPHSNLLNLTADKSISAWYKIESSTGLTYYPIIIYKPGINPYPTFGIFLHEDPAYGSTQHKVSFIQGGGSTNKENVTSQDYRNYVNQWIHIVATHSSSDKYMRIYFNGVISDSLYVGTFTSNTSTDSLRIGRGYAPYNANSFKGLIDDVRIYNRALTKQEVDSLYKEHFFVYRNQQLTICQGDSVLAGGKYQKITGNYYDTIALAYKVDSIVVTQLTVNPTYLIPQTVTACSGGKILLGGKLQTTAGVYYDSLQTTNGCDSVIQTTLIVNPSYYITRTIPLCNGQSFFAGGGNQTSTGIYYDSLLTAKGCDSVIVTNLVINLHYISSRNVELCNGESILIGGTLRTTTGTYYDSLLTWKGCDSIIITHLTVNPTYFFNRTAVICNGDSILLGNTYRKTAGIYYDTLHTKKGCDSIKITSLIINPSYFTSTSMAICNGDSVFIAGLYRNTAGTYQENFNTKNGCDSIVETTLIINPTYFKADTITICLGDSALIAGNYYYTHAIVSQNLSTAKGCDSIIVTTLIVNPSYVTTHTINLCAGDSALINGSYIKTPGLYYDSLTSSTGCDSIVVTTVWINVISPLVSQNSYILIAQESGATYQWLDCNNSNAPISGETQQSLIANSPGSYAVEITKNSCTVTSACYTVISSLGINSTFKENVSVYPNPAKNWFTVDLKENHAEIKVSIMSISGQLLTTYVETNNSAIKIPSDQLAAGVYLLEIVADGQKSISKIIIE